MSIATRSVDVTPLAGFEVAALRNESTGESSLREPIAAWAREHGLDV